VKLKCSSFDDLQKCNGLPVPLLGQASLPISKIDPAYQYHRTVSTTLPQGARYTFGGIVALPLRITTCRFLLAIVFRTWGLVCINLSFASREFVCARSTAFAHDLDSHCISVLSIGVDTTLSASRVVYRSVWAFAWGWQGLHLAWEVPKNDMSCCQSWLRKIFAWSVTHFRGRRS